MPEINVRLKVSKQFFYVMSFIIFGSLFIIFYVNLFLMSKLLLLIFVMIYGLYILNRYVLLRHSASIVKLIFNKNGFFLENAEGVFPVQIAGESTLTSLVCILRYSVTGKTFKQSCVIWNDALDPVQYRRLLVALRTGTE